MKGQGKTDALILDDITITYAHKLLYPKSGNTKGDVARYYASAADRMLPYLKNRLMSSVRCIEKVGDACFFRRHPVKERVGVGLMSVTEASGSTGEYYYIKNEQGLLSEVDASTIEFHPWGSTVENLEYPDTMIFDLDPDEGMSLEDIRSGVKDIKSILDERSLISFLKATGGKGYHVVIPVNPQKNWDEFRVYAKNLAILMEERWPDRYTSNSRKSKRQGRIYIDWQRNIRSGTAIAPYALRAREGASIAMPLSWSELNTIAPNHFNLNNVIERFSSEDPWMEYFNTNQSLT